MLRILAALLFLKKRAFSLKTPVFLQKKLDESPRCPPCRQTSDLGRSRFLKKDADTKLR